MTLSPEARERVLNEVQAMVQADALRFVSDEEADETDDESVDEPEDEE